MIHSGMGDGEHSKRRVIYGSHAPHDEGVSAGSEEGDTGRYILPLPIVHMGVHMGE